VKSRRVRCLLRCRHANPDADVAWTFAELTGRDRAFLWVELSDRDEQAIGAFMTQVAALPAPATRKDPVHLWWKAQLLRKWDVKRRVQVSPVSTAVRVAGSPSLLSPARSRRILENYTVAAHQEKFASCRDRNSARRFILKRT